MSYQMQTSFLLPQRILRTLRVLTRHHVISQAPEQPQRELRPFVQQLMNLRHQLFHVRVLQMLFRSQTLVRKRECHENGARQQSLPYKDELVTAEGTSESQEEQKTPPSFKVNSSQIWKEN
jgi:hypothetical protein